MAEVVQNMLLTLDTSYRHSFTFQCINKGLMFDSLHFSKTIPGTQKVT